MKKEKRSSYDFIFLNEIISVLTSNGALCGDIEDACLMPKGYLQHLIDHPNEVRLTDVALIAAVRRMDVFFNVHVDELSTTGKSYLVDKSFNSKSE